MSGRIIQGGGPFTNRSHHFKFPLQHGGQRFQHTCMIVGDSNSQFHAQITLSPREHPAVCVQSLTQAEIGYLMKWLCVRCEQLDLRYQILKFF